MTSIAGVHYYRREFMVRYATGENVMIDFTIVSFDSINVRRLRL